MIQDYPDDWIDDAIRRACNAANLGPSPGRIKPVRAKMLAIKEAARNAPVRWAPNIRPSDESDIRLALYLRAGDLLGTNRKSGQMRS